MEDTRVDRLFAHARAGRLSRRQLLDTGLRLGLTSPVIVSLIEAAPKTASAEPAAPTLVSPARAAVQVESSGTLTVL